MKSIVSLIGASAFSLLLSGCVTFPVSAGFPAQAQPGVTVPTVVQDPQAYVGHDMVWGGIIINTANQQQTSDITIRETPLTAWEQPVGGNYSYGRFIAQFDGFLDPSVYAPGREITVAGPVQGVESRPLNGQPYNYVILTAREVHLWTGGNYPSVPPYYYYRYPPFFRHHGFGFYQYNGPRPDLNRGIVPKGPVTIVPFRGPDGVKPDRPDGAHVRPYHGPSLSSPDRPGGAAVPPYYSHKLYPPFPHTPGNGLGTGHSGPLHRKRLPPKDENQNRF